MIPNSRGLLLAALSPNKKHRSRVVQSMAFCFLADPVECFCDERINFYPLDASEIQ